MRTTLNIDEDVATEIAAAARRDGTSLSRTANALLRAGLHAGRRPANPDRYDPPVFDTGRPLVDVTDVAAALETLDRDE